MQPIEQRLQAQLDHRKSINAFRTLPQPSARIDFCSNDYLGFARDSAELFQLSGAPTGATGSRLISGNAPAFERLERRLAHYFNAPAALLFNSGYSANIGLIACMATRHDTILYDQLAHASIREGLLLSPARTYNFRHNDLVHLEERLKKAQGNRFVIVESIYSMDGDQAPLREMVDLCQHYQAALVVDEAHGTGVYGKKGEGVVVKLGLEERVWARIYTFGKALGAHGAVVAGSQTLRDYLINFSRAFIYTTALPLSSIEHLEQAFDVLQSTSRIEQLRQRICLFRDQLEPVVAAQMIESTSAIQCLIIPGNEEVKAIATDLQARGFDVKAILHPTVPKGEERLRICLHAFNTEEEIRHLAKAINECAKVRTA